MNLVSASVLVSHLETSFDQTSRWDSRTEKGRRSHGRFASPSDYSILTTRKPGWLPFLILGALDHLLFSLSLVEFSSSSLKRLDLTPPGMDSECRYPHVPNTSVRPLSPSEPFRPRRLLLLSTCTSRQQLPEPHPQSSL